MWGAFVWNVPHVEPQLDGTLCYCTFPAAQQNRNTRQRQHKVCVVSWVYYQHASLLRQRNSVAIICSDRRHGVVFTKETHTKFLIKERTGRSRWRPLIVIWPCCLAASVRNTSATCVIVCLHILYIAFQTRNILTTHTNPVFLADLSFHKMPQPTGNNRVVWHFRRWVSNLGRKVNQQHTCDVE